MLTPSTLAELAFWDNASPHIFLALPQWGVRLTAMPDTRKHRGPRPDDVNIFSEAKRGDLQRAMMDYSMLLSRGYAQKSLLKLVGDHFALTERQRLAIMRSACSDAQLACRRAKELDVSQLAGRQLEIDGYNLLITTESALSGAPIFVDRDGCMRDLSGIHGSYRKVEETVPAIELIARHVLALGVTYARWLFDSPVSNSGRLKTLLGELIARHGWPFEVELHLNPDSVLIASDKPVATSDSNILDECGHWVNLITHILCSEMDAGRLKINLVDLSCA